VKVQAILERHDAAKIVFRYTVWNTTTNKIAATGMTMQVFMNAENRELELAKPEFYEVWENNQTWMNE
jgi:acyl-CoA thioester hydrolase